MRELTEKNKTFIQGYCINIYSDDNQFNNHKQNKVGYNVRKVGKKLQNLVFFFFIIAGLFMFNHCSVLM